MRDFHSPYAPSSNAAPRTQGRFNVGRASCQIILNLIVLLSLAGCDAVQPEVADCERFLKAKLLAPSTYRRVEAYKMVMDDRNPPEMWASVTYDAANAYGAPIRGTQICRYPLVNGRADISRYIDHDALLMEDEVAAPSDAATNEPDAPSNPHLETSRVERGLPQEDQPRPAKKVVSEVELCWEGYCPCDPPQGGPDQLLCDQLRMGKADPEMLSVGKSMRETRRQISEYQF